MVQSPNSSLRNNSSGCLVDDFSRCRKLYDEEISVAQVETLPGSANVLETIQMLQARRPEIEGRNPMSQMEDLGQLFTGEAKKSGAIERKLLTMRQ